MKRCTYYETCSTYGLNVERVFQDGNSGAGRDGAPRSAPQEALRPAGAWAPVGAGDGSKPGFSLSPQRGN